MADLDWSNVDKEMRLHIVQNASTYVDGQLRLATAADQRASALAGAFTAAGTALIAGLIVFGTASKIPTSHPYPVFIGGGISAVAFIAAGLLCIVSALPAGMYLPGSQPKSWNNDIRAKLPYDDCLKEEAGVLQSKIDDNRRTIDRNARLFRWGALLGISAPLVGTLVWALTSSAYLF